MNQRFCRHRHRENRKKMCFWNIHHNLILKDNNLAVELSKLYINKKIHQNHLVINIKKFQEVIMNNHRSFFDLHLEVLQHRIKKIGRCQHASAIIRMQLAILYHYICDCRQMVGVYKIQLLMSGMHNLQMHCMLLNDKQEKKYQKEIKFNNLSEWPKQKRKKKIFGKWQ